MIVAGRVNLFEYMWFAHSSYQQGKDGSIKMHRTVTSEDVVEYPMHVPPRDIQLVKEEDVEYREGRLFKSNGTTHVSLNQKFADNSPTSDTPGDDPAIDIFTFDGSYSMELKVCRLAPQATRKRRAITRQRLASDSCSEENLMAAYNESKCVGGSVPCLYTMNTLHICDNEFLFIS